MDPRAISADKLFSVLVVSATDRDLEVPYTLDGTHYGRLLLVFRVGGEIDTFKEYAQQTLRGPYTVQTMMVVADNLDQVCAELTKRDLLPAGSSRVVLEGTEFFDEVIAQLMTDTIWAEENPG